VFAEAGGKEEFELRWSAVEHVKFVLVEVLECADRVEPEFFRQDVECMAVE
jgi:hypothetical protein